MRLFGSCSVDFQRSPVSNRPASVSRQVSASILSAFSSSLVVGSSVAALGQ